VAGSCERGNFPSGYGLCFMELVSSLVMSLVTMERAGHSGRAV
jgi:hypothetical protein